MLFIFFSVGKFFLPTRPKHYQFPNIPSYKAAKQGVAAAFCFESKSELRELNRCNSLTG
jgi:hypothetical protein